MKHLILYVCALACALTARAGQASFRSYMAVDGLSDNSVLCGLRDSYGFVWLGTNNGLNCFDGQHNVVFRNMVSADVSYENNVITSLLEQDGDIWFGGSFGLYVYQRATNAFSRFRLPTKYGVIISSTVQRMGRTPNGIIWICTLGQGLFLYDTQTGTLTQDSRHNSFLTDLVVGTDGYVYLATIDGHVMVYGIDGRFERQYVVPGFVFDKGHMCIERVGGHLFIGCDQGLFQLSVRDHAVQPVGLSGEVGIVRALLAQGTDRLLLGTDHGLYAYDLSTSAFSRIDNPTQAADGLSDDLINGLFTDVDGTLWVLTEHGGVCYQPAAPGNLEVIDLPSQSDRASRNMVRAFSPASENSVWVGTDAALFAYGLGGAGFLPPPPGMTRMEVSALLSDGDELWVGTPRNGLFVVDTRTGARRHYTYSSDRPYTLLSNAVNALLRTRDGHIYVGTSWGLCLYEPATDRFMGFSEVSSMTAFVSLVEDADGTIWAASSNHGLFRKRHDDVHYSNYITRTDDPHSLPSNALTAVYCDSRGDVWVATKDGGLCRYDAATDGFEPFAPSAPQLANSQVCFLQEDEQQRLWVGTENGILRIDPDRTHIVEASTYPADKQREQRARNAVFHAEDGTLLVGSNGHILRIDPRRTLAEEKPAPVYVMGISLPYVADSQTELHSMGLDHPLYTTGQITLSHADNSFTLHFAAPRFGSRRQPRYEYMLEGFDKTWVHGTENDEATYANMQPGTYEFLLREVGVDAPSAYARLRITIQPPWYRTTLAYILYIALFLLALVIVLRRYNRQVNRRYNKRMEEFRIRQEQENFQSKINFFINLVHEIRTPLSLISLPLEQMEDGELSDDDRRHVSSIRRNLNYLLGITNQLLDFQKAENGKVILHSTYCDVGRLLSEICAQFEDAMQVQGKRLQLQLPETPVRSSLDRDKVSKVLMNLLGNAQKYARTEIILRLEQTDDDHFRISVIDDGPGIPAAERAHIFDVYYQIAGDDTAATLGTGLGLAYAKMLALAHDGDLDVTDAVGGGSNFILTLPIRKGTPTPALPSQPTEDVAEPVEASAASTHRILVVEDNEELLTSICEGLRKWYRVLKAHDGVEALDVLKHQDVDVIVSDVMMPRMDGNELCRTLKSDINYSHLPVILLTAKTTVEAKVEGMQSGADIYLEKPFSMKQLHLQITSLLRMRQRFYERMRQLDGTPVPVSNETEYGVNEQDQKFLLRLQELIEHNLRDEEFSIDVLAEQMNMSRSSFYRKIKALTDQTPIDYLKTQRLERAAQLLRRGERITEVAVQVGFASSSYFAKCFRAKYGVLPKEYVAGSNGG